MHRSSERLLSTQRYYLPFITPNLANERRQMLPFRFFSATQSVAIHIPFPFLRVFPPIPRHQYLTLPVKR